MIGAVILAAGAGRRLGGAAKATLVVDAGGDSFLARIVGIARQAQVDRFVVVAGEPHRAATEREAARLGLAVAINPEPGRGMGSSVAVGFAAAATELAGAVAALLWPVDHPFVDPATVRELCARATLGGVVIPTRGGRGGHPVLAGRSVWAELARAGEFADGARAVFRARPDRVRRIEVADDGVIADVDHPADMP